MVDDSQFKATDYREFTLHSAFGLSRMSGGLLKAKDFLEPITSFSTGTGEIPTPFPP